MPESNGNGEYQIPESAKTEFIPVPDQPEIIEASLFDDETQSVAQHEGTLVRGTPDYEMRADLLVKQAEQRIERQKLIALGNDIHTLRQAEIEKRLDTSKAGIMKRVLDMIMTGQFSSSVDKARLTDETFRALMNEESAVGASVIPMSPTVRRQEFFLSDDPRYPNEWFYHAQSLIRPSESITLRYVVSEPDGIYKSIDGGQYVLLESKELSDFLDLTRVYADQLMNGPYKNVSRSDFSLAA